MKLRCQAPGCVADFEAKRATAKFCSSTCRSRANRARPARGGSVTALFGKADFRSALELRVYLQLEDAGRLDTIAGQQALTLAAQLAHPSITASGSAAVSKELSRVVDEALAGASVGEPDFVDEMRSIRDRKRAETSRAEVPESPAVC